MSIKRTWLKFSDLGVKVGQTIKVLHPRGVPTRIAQPADDYMEVLEVREKQIHVCGLFNRRPSWMGIYYYVDFQGKVYNRRVMRIWGIDPKLLCRQHLLGEHRELHTMVGSIRKGISLTKYLETGLIDTRMIKSRHTVIVGEMERRGYQHKSSLTYQDKIKSGFIDLGVNIQDLIDRCPRCRARIIKEQMKDGKDIPPSFTHGNRRTGST